jgi:uncharacterized protein with beta-barrel porin domain
MHARRLICWTGGMRMRFPCRALLGLSLLALPAFVGTARAQAAPETCEGISGVNEPLNAEVYGCLKPIIDYHALIAVSDAVRKVVAGRLAAEAEDVAELSGLVADGGIAIEPTADIPTEATQRRLWNAWIDGKYSWIEGKSEVDHSKGPLTNVMIGIDYRLASSVVFGVIGAYEGSRLETQGLLPIVQKTEGYGGGAYVGITVTPNIIFSGMATYAAIDTELDRSLEGDTDSDRIQVSGAFTGYWYSGHAAVALAHSCLVEGMAG